MDLVSGAGRVLVVMDHLTRKGGPKLVAECDLPLTGRRVVQRVITDLGVFDVDAGRFRVVELAPGITFDQAAASTGAPLVAAESLTRT
jgi:3-oxoacid CoA-transferase subunit B